MKIAALVSIFLLVLSGCSKNSSTEKDTILPVINIATPSPGQTFIAGQFVQITGTVTDNNYVAETHIHVYNNNTGALLMDVHLYPAAASANFDQSITAAAGTNYKIQVIAKDKAANEAISTVQVSCN